MSHNHFIFYFLFLHNLSCIVLLPSENVGKAVSPMMLWLLPLDSIALELLGLCHFQYTSLNRGIKDQS